MIYASMERVFQTRGKPSSKTFFRRSSDTSLAHTCRVLERIPALRQHRPWEMSFPIPEWHPAPREPLGSDGQPAKKPKSVGFRLPVVLDFKYVYAETNYLPNRSQVCIFGARIVLYRQFVIAEYPSK